MLTASLHLAPASPTTVRFSGALHRSGGRTTWKGSASASEPIVAMSFLKHEEQLCWSQSPKVTADILPVSMLLAEDREGERDILYVTWAIGRGQTQIGLSELPQVEMQIPEEKDVLVGQLFPFVDLSPSTSLFGLLLLRSQVKGKRNHRWELKEEYLDGLPLVWKDIMKGGRTGTALSGILDDA